MPTLDSIFQFIDSRREESLSLLKDFLRIPSVSTRPEHAPDLRRCAHWLADQISQTGLWARVEETGGHPAVLAGTERRPDRPTVLIYGHYDVQPVEPLDQWTTPPFEPAERNGALYARGAADDKGQVWTHVEAILAWQRQGGLPVNLVILFEGEEEIGSENLARFVENHKADLAADIAVISDSGQFARGIPAITCGLRGLTYMEVIVTGPSHDLHSGVFGGSVANPANVLCQLLATLHDKRGRVNIPGFYDDVARLPRAERKAWKSLPFDEAAALLESGAPASFGEKGFTTLERRWARPTCDINGLTSGYQGPGAKTIIPAKASAKVSMRLVPNQNPRKIIAAFQQALRDRCPATVQLQILEHSAAPPVLVPHDGPAMKCALAALEKGFGAKPVFIREGGSIPVVGLFKSLLGIETLLVGYGLPDDRVHSPNEKFDLDALHNGTRASAALYEELSRLTR